MAIEFKSGRKVQTKSTAAAKVPPQRAIAKRGLTDVSINAIGVLEGEITQEAGTQALLVDTLIDEWTASIIQKHKDRLAYQAQYQRWLRAASKLGLSVKQYREGKR